GDVNKRTRALEAIVKGCAPVRDVAVLLSANSIWAKLPLTPPRDWMQQPSSPAVVGAHTALVENHIQFSILNSETLVETLRDYKALIVPEQSALSDDEVKAIRDFVARGGALIATGEAPALAGILGIRYLGW